MVLEVYDLVSTQFFIFLQQTPRTPISQSEEGLKDRKKIE